MDLRPKIASGSVINLGFALANGCLFVLNLLVMTRLLDPEQFGLFSIALAFVEAIILLSDFGVAEKFVQDISDEPDRAYRLALTANLCFSLGMLAVILVLAPVLAWVYGRPTLWPLLSLCSYSAFTGTLLMPLALYYRRLQFLRQRLFPTFGRLVGLGVMALLAWQGLGVWSLPLGGLASLVATAVPLWLSAPIPRGGLCFDWSASRAYWRFGANLWAARLGAVLTQHGAILFLSVKLSFVQLGQFKLSETVASIAFLVQLSLAQTVYPILCRMQQAPQQRRQVFVLLSKIGQAWAMPVGLGLVIFSADLVRHVFGSKWSGMELLLVIQGSAVIIGSIGHSWDAFMRSTGNSRPLLVGSLLLAGTFAAVFVPAVLLWGVPGIAVGIGAVVLGGLALKQHYMNRLFAPISLVRIVLPELLAGAVSGGAVMVWKLASGSASTSASMWLAQVAAFMLGYCGLAALLDRTLARQALAFLIGLKRNADELNEVPVQAGAPAPVDPAGRTAHEFGPDCPT